MEENDDLVAEPDVKGIMELTNRAWVHVDMKVFEYSTKIAVLDISYNQIHDLPVQIGELSLMREFKASFNKITSIPVEIGKLKRLRKMFLNGNQIRQLPLEIGKLEMLEELVVSENKLEGLPMTVSLMGSLRVLKLQNNNLRMIPNTLADVVTLEEIDCSNNDKLEMVPLSWRGDSYSVLFICRLHRDYALKMEEMVATNNDFQKHAQFLEQQQLIVKEKIVEYKSLNDELNKFIRPQEKVKMEMARKKMIEDDGAEKKVKIDDCVIM